MRIERKQTRPNWGVYALCLAAVLGAAACDGSGAKVVTPDGSVNPDVGIPMPRTEACVTDQGCAGERTCTGTYCDPCDCKLITKGATWDLPATGEDMTVAPDGTAFVLLAAAPWVVALPLRAAAVEPVAGPAALDWGRKIFAAADGSFAVVGSVKPSSTVFLRAERYAADGTLLATAMLDTMRSDSYFADAAARPDGTIAFLSGYPTYPKYDIVTLTPTGAWARVASGSTEDYAQSIAFGSNSAITIAGNDNRQAFVRHYVLPATTPSWALMFSPPGTSSAVAYTPADLRFAADGSLYLVWQTQHAFEYPSVGVQRVRDAATAWTAYLTPDGGVTTAEAILPLDRLLLASFGGANVFVAALDELGVEIDRETGVQAIDFEALPAAGRVLALGGLSIQELQIALFDRPPGDQGDRCDRHADCLSVRCCRPQGASPGVCGPSAGCGTGSKCEMDSDCAGVCVRGACTRTCAARTECTASEYCVPLACTGCPATACVPSCLSGSAVCTTFNTSTTCRQVADVDGASTFACVP